MKSRPPKSKRPAPARARRRTPDSFPATVIARMADGLCVCHEVPGFPFVTFTVWNERMVQITGYRKAEINRLGWYQTMYPDPDLRQRARERMARMRDGEDLVDEEWTITRKDGVARVLRISTSVLESAGGQIHVQALMQDVSEHAQAEAALRASEERYRSLFENVPIGIYRTTPDGRVVAANPALVAMLGYDSFAELAERNIERDGVERDRPRQRFKALVELQGEVHGLENRWVRRDGKVIHVRENARAIRAADGTVLFYEGTIEDITERRRTEAELRGQQAEVHAIKRLLLDSLLRDTPEQLAHGCLVVAEELTGSVCGFIGDLNAAGRCDLIGCSVPDWDAGRSPDGPAGGRLQDLAPCGLWGQVLETGRPILINDPAALPDGVGLPPGHPPLTAFLGVPLKSGRLTTGLIGLLNKPGGYEPSDQRAVEDLAVAFLELQRRKWTEVALRQSETRNRALVKALPDLIFLVNRQGVLVDFHAGNPTLLYVPPEEFVDRPMRDVLPPAVADGLEQGARRALETRTTQSFEYPLLIRGEQFHFEARLAACGDDLVIFIVRDITVQKRAEAERRELLQRIVQAQEEERQRLAHELHDELGQELTALQLRIKVLESHCPPGMRGHRDLAALRPLADRLLRRVHDLAWELRPALLDNLGFHPALQRLVTDWSEEHGVAADCHLHSLEAEPVPRQLATALFRVAQEALRNVARHAHARTVSVLLQRRRDDLVLVVEDDGEGFDVASVMKSPDSRDRLGLIGMQERLRALAGTLQIESRPGKGTTVIASAPAVHKPADGSGAAPAARRRPRTEHET